MLGYKLEELKPKHKVTVCDRLAKLDPKVRIEAIRNLRARNHKAPTPDQILGEAREVMDPNYELHKDGARQLCEIEDKKVLDTMLSTLPVPYLKDLARAIESDEEVRVVPQGRPRGKPVRVAICDQWEERTKYFESENRRLLRDQRRGFIMNSNMRPTVSLDLD